MSSQTPTIIQATLWSGQHRNAFLPLTTPPLIKQANHHVWLTNNNPLNVKQLQAILPTSKTDILKHDSEFFDIDPYLHPASPDNQQTKAKALEIIAKHVCSLYNLLLQHLQTFSETPDTYVLIVEDDVVIPDDFVARAIHHFQTNSAVGTVIGRMVDRRLHQNHNLSQVIAVDFTESTHIGEYIDTTVTPNPVLVNLKQHPTIGTRAIGSGHMGCWMTPLRYLLSPFKFLPKLDGLQGCDLVWGLQLHRIHGKRVLLDWSAKCQHLYYNSNHQLTVAQ